MEDDDPVPWDAREHWNQRYGDGAPDQPAPFLLDRAALVPTAGRALDVAGGAGRNAIWLARHGLDVTLVDGSDTGCALARRRAASAGVSLRVVRADLDVEPLPPGPWDAVVIHHFLDRAVLAAAAGELAAGGVLLFAQPTVRNLERHDRPPRRWLLGEGELARLADRLHAASAVEVVEATEGWTDGGRHEARLVLRRPAG